MTPRLHGARTVRFVERSLWGAAIVCALVGARAWHRAQRLPRLAASVWGDAPPLAALPNADSVSMIITRIAEADPFRLARHPSLVGYHPGGDPNAATSPPLTPPTPPKPPLAVAGIVGGPPWAALLDGVPGHEGSVLVHAGDTLSGLTVRSIRPTSVTITGLDTTWRLSIKRPWY